MQRHATVMFDNGRIVRCWRETVTQKYSSLPGIRDLHDFLTLRNVGENALMKVRTNCYSGTLKSTPMAIRKGMSAADGFYQDWASPILQKEWSNSYQRASRAI